MMSGFEKLRDESNFIANQLRQTSLSFSVLTAGKTKDSITKKTQDLKVLSAKLKLLQAKPLSLTPQIANQPHDKVLEDYDATVALKLLESDSVNTFTTCHVYKGLVCTPDDKLDQEMRVTKKAIIESLSQYYSKAMWLNNLSSILKEREVEYAELKVQREKSLTALKSLPNQRNENEDGDRGPLMEILRTLVGKLELMRWLIKQMLCAPTPYYDWISDPHRRVSILDLVRQNYTVDMFTQD